MLQVEGKKMSKSLGNFFTVRDLLDQGIPGEVIRLVFLQTHYRKNMDWTARKVREAQRTLKVWFSATDGIEASENAPAEFMRILGNDLNTVGAISMMHELVRSDDFADLKASLRLLGFPDSENCAWFREGFNMASIEDMPYHVEYLTPLLDQWMALRHAKDYEAADKLKSIIEDCGIRLSIGVAGPEAKALPSFDPTKLEALK